MSTETIQSSVDTLSRLKHSLWYIELLSLIIHASCVFSLFALCLCSSPTEDRASFPHFGFRFDHVICYDHLDDSRRDASTGWKCVIVHVSHTSIIMRDKSFSWLAAATQPEVPE